MALKAELRREFRRRRQSFHQSAPASVGASLHASLAQLLPKTSALWGGYRPCASESSFHEEQLQTPWIQWAYPRVLNQEQMEFRKIKNNQQIRWELNQWKIPEPSLEDSVQVSHEEIYGVVVPALAFDREGYRLGSGLGFYDRWLKDFSGKKVGFAYSVQVSEQPLPREAHDIRMDILVTDQEVLVFNPC